jgi:hypothetical protein
MNMESDPFTAFFLLPYLFLWRRIERPNRATAPEVQFLHTGDTSGHVCCPFRLENNEMKSKMTRTVVVESRPIVANSKLHTQRQKSLAKYT